jgi:hypothetical protein
MLLNLCTEIKNLITLIDHYYKYQKKIIPDFFYQNEHFSYLKAFFITRFNFLSVNLT